MPATGRLRDLPVGSRVEVGTARDAAPGPTSCHGCGGGPSSQSTTATLMATPAARHPDGISRRRLVAPVPDGSCDFTAHVAVDALEHDELTTSATRSVPSACAETRVGVAHTDPTGYLAALAAASAGRR